MSDQPQPPEGEQPPLVHPPLDPAPPSHTPPVADAPAPGYGAPDPGYGAPDPGYGAPAPGYGTPPVTGTEQPDFFGAPVAPAGYGAPAPQQPWGPPSGYAAPPRTPGKAIAVLVLGIVSLVLMCGYGIGVITAIIALCLAPSAKREIKASPYTLTGAGLVTAGVICSWIAIGITVVAVLALLLLVATF